MVVRKLDSQKNQSGSISYRLPQKSTQNGFNVLNLRSETKTKGEIIKGKLLDTDLCNNALNVTSKSKDKQIGL